jgi:hypothetical protein
MLARSSFISFIKEKNLEAKFHYSDEINVVFLQSEKEKRKKRNKRKTP